MKKALWAGRVISALPVLMLTAGGVMAVLKPPAALEGMKRLGYPERLSVPIGVVLLASVALYAVPRTAVLGAVLLTAYLGGATASHVRVGDPFVVAVVVAVLVWVGLLLRDARLRALLPFRTPPHH